MSSKVESIILFSQQKIRRQWNGKKELWYFAVVDVIAALTESNNQQAYWRVFKKRLTDVADTQTMLRLIQSIPSPNAEPFNFYNI